MSILWWRGRASKAAFRDRITDALRQRCPEATIEVTGELDLRISGIKAGSQMDAWLGRGQEELCKNPKQVDEIVQRYAGSLLAIIIDPPLELDHIVPTLKPSGWLNEQRALYAQQGTIGDFHPCVEPCNASIRVVYAEYHTALHVDGDPTVENILKRVGTWTAERNVAASGGLAGLIGERDEEDLRAGPLARSFRPQSFRCTTLSVVKWKTVLECRVSPGRSTVEGKRGSFGLFGKCSVSSASPSP